MARREIGAIEGLILVEPRKFGDHRGFFSETYNRERMAALGFAREFIQDNHALSGEAGTLRGIHFQSPPFAQDKLVRVVRGRILDVAVDIRKGSPTFGDHVAVELSAENWRQLLVPAGFGHGYLTLEPGTEVIYKVTAPYAPANDHGFLWSDPDLGIDWGTSDPVLSDKDRALPPLAAIESPFAWEGPR
ncbi:dTDP-4-dehydrorhamnose 3,5-epimerase [Amaricoccus sp.]|uniref:dTDP-4-dehydrorhamnose 3,5-epimerase n=1 Tax=Amaricoccus sp. TaxID=1872485 RepID=UPI001B72845A|nr:dTDP-4-dehydrorhamnose 3,5-epimerase [Amaricoccus sp.]MBP7003004.1 dTDP-4-dehydrorhamnose 3,5-epimerase [Amaricoccus sp.]